jgi:hypothetical protein
VKEQEYQGLPFTAIRIDLKNKKIAFQSEETTVFRLDFSGDTVLFEGDAVNLGETQAAAEDTEQERKVTLTGRIKGKVKEGRADKSGNPTAWSQFAAHVDGHKQPVIYSATFHRQARRIALALKSGDQLTVEGYPHESATPGRWPTLSVFHIPHYEGKPPRT